MKKNIINNYYFSSFFWSTLSKVLNAVFGFISVPLLIGYFGKSEYGVLSIATACNSYMHLMDLGMNTGAVKFFSQWRATGKIELLNRVARTNLSFYLIVSIINAVVLVLLGVCGESFFSISHENFLQLRICLYILALFSLLSWAATTFNQLLIADKQIVYTQIVNCILIIFKFLLIIFLFFKPFSLSLYFFILTAIMATYVFPLAGRCLKKNLVDTIRPGFYWRDFRIVLTFSLSIFALSLFQVTASQSRPIILSIFAENGADVVADFRILEVIPQLIIMIGGTFSSIFLPQSSQLIANGDYKKIVDFSMKWTNLTTIIVASLCFPFILCANEVISAYVGSKFVYLSPWLIAWCFIVLVQMHPIPCYSLIIAKGKTKKLVGLMAVSCVLSIIINASLCSILSVGSAIIGYGTYVLIVMTSYYIAFYKQYLNLPRWKILWTFLKPTIIAIVTSGIFFCLPLSFDFFEFQSVRTNYICICLIKTSLWLLVYYTMITLLGILNIKTPQLET